MPRQPPFVRLHRARAGWLAACLLGVLVPAGVAGQTPNPPSVYFLTTPDAITGDNTPVSWTGSINGVSCTTLAPCYLPDVGADSYTQDVYERPTGLGPGSDQASYYGHVDIVSSAVAYDDSFLYYRFTLYSSPLTGKYGFEINFDSDTQGDLFVEVDDPAAKVPLAWETNHVTAYLDSDNSVGGLTPLGPDGPGNINGYETKIFNVGNNQYPGNPGGNDAIQARTSGNWLEIAVKRTFLNAVNGSTVTKAAFRPLASRIPFNEDDYYIHDNDHRQKIGSPYPWLTSGGAPASCPTVSDASLTVGQRNALQSGTNSPTSHINPCFPNFQLREIDVGGTVSDLATPTLQFNVDMSVTKTASSNSVLVGDTLTYTITATNNNTGSGVVSNVVVRDTLPAGFSFVSAVSTLGTCSGTTVLVCDIGGMINQESAVITVKGVVTAAGSVVNRARVSANETDTNTANNVGTVTVTAITGSVVVISDGVDTLPRLPSGSVAAYSYGFRVSHTLPGTWDLGLKAYAASGGSVITVDSIKGPAVTQVAADTASLLGRTSANADSVYVWFSVATGLEGATDSLYLRARIVGKTISDTGYVHVERIRPDVALEKAATPTDPQQILPGAEVTYTITFSNVGSAQASDVVVRDSLPTQLYYKVGSADETLANGNTAVLEFSNHPTGASWGYTPQSGGCGAPTGFDGCVTYIRWTLANPLGDPDADPGNGGSVQFVTRVR